MPINTLCWRVARRRIPLSVYFCGGKLLSAL